MDEWMDASPFQGSKLAYFYLALAFRTTTTTIITITIVPITAGTNNSNNTIIPVTHHSPTGNIYSAAKPRGYVLHPPRLKLLTTLNVLPSASTSVQPPSHSLLPLCMPLPSSGLIRPLFSSPLKSLVPEVDGDRSTQQPMPTAGERRSRNWRKKQKRRQKRARYNLPSLVETSATPILSVVF